jgi:hypothetical protein
MDIIDGQVMVVRTYNVAIGFPACFKQPQGLVVPRYSGHAKDQALSDRYGPFRLPREVDLGKVKVVEVTYENGKLTKLVCRMRYQYDPTKDLVIVLRSNGVVPTVWGNLVSDVHRTLDHSKFTSPGVSP